MSNPFDWLNAINDNKKDLFAAGETGYNAFMVNRGLSYFPDTVMAAQEMNMLPGLDADMQFYFYLNAVKKRKRFGKWAKAAKTDDIEAVKKSYGYSTKRALEVLPILTPAQLKILRDQNGHD